MPYKMISKFKKNSPVKKIISSIGRIGLVATIPFVVLSSSLNAAEKGHMFNIGGKAVTITVPDGYCKMDPNNKNDKLIIDGVRKSIAGSNDLLIQFADCTELKNWRTGKLKYLNNFGSYQTSIKLKTTDLTGQEAATVKGICDIFRKQGGSMVEELKPEINKRIKDGFDKIKMNELKMLGVVHEDPTICAAATFQRLQTEDKSIKDQINVYSITFINGRMVFTYLYGPDSDKVMLVKLTDKIKKTHQANIAINKK